MKADRQRLASEKTDLVSQIKQLYNTLKDKEAELRDFIRSYEQRNKDNNDLIKQVGWTHRPPSQKGDGRGWLLPAPIGLGIFFSKSSLPHIKPI